MRTLMMGLLAGLALAACNDNRDKGTDGDGLDRVNQSQTDRVKAEADRLEKKADADKDRADKTGNDALKARADREERNAKATKNAADDSKKVDDERYGDGVQGKSPTPHKRTTTRTTRTTQ